MPVRYKGGGGGSSGGGDSTGAWAEDATVGDAVAVGSVLVEEAETADALGLVGSSMVDAATVDDALSSTTEPAWAEDATVGDAVAVGSVLEDPAAVDDAFASMVTKLAEDATVADDVVAGTLLADDASVNDRLRARVIVTDPGRTATPSTDLLAETHVLQATPTVNAGTAAPALVQSATALNAAAIIAFFEIDLTPFAGMVAQAVASPFTLTFKVSQNSALVASGLGHDLRRHTAKPFVEDTVTWNTKPVSTLGTSVVAGSTSIPALNVLVTVTITMTEAQLNSSLTDGWLFLVLSSTSAVTRELFSIQSRESASVADRPQIELLLAKGT